MPDSPSDDVLVAAVRFPMTVSMTFAELNSEVVAVFYGMSVVDASLLVDTHLIRGTM